MHIQGEEQTENSLFRYGWDLILLQKSKNKLRLGSYIAGKAKARYIGWGFVLLKMLK